MKLGLLIGVVYAVVGFPIVALVEARLGSLPAWSPYLFVGVAVAIAAVVEWWDGSREHQEGDADRK